VHAHPDLLRMARADSDAIMVHATLAVLRSKDLKARLRGRGKQVPQRRAKRYLNSFESIWMLQSFLLSEADRCEVPIITNQDKDRSVNQIVLHVNQELGKRFRGTASEVFGESEPPQDASAETSVWREYTVRLQG